MLVAYFLSLMPLEIDSTPKNCFLHINFSRIHNAFHMDSCVPSFGCHQHHGITRASIEPPFVPSFRAGLDLFELGTKALGEELLVPPAPRWVQRCGNPVPFRVPRALRATTWCGQSKIRKNTSEVRQCQLNWIWGP